MDHDEATVSALRTLVGELASELVPASDHDVFRETTVLDHTCDVQGLDA